MTAGSFLEGKLLRPQANRWISVRGHTSALLTTYNRAPPQSLPPDTEAVGERAGGAYLAMDFRVARLI
jgi:hypothetical protein